MKNEINNTTDDIPEPKNGHKALEEELWFHGVLPRGEVVRLLVTDGDFLVRETVRNDEKQIVLSVMWTSPRHFIGKFASSLSFLFLQNLCKKNPYELQIWWLIIRNRYFEPRSPKRLDFCQILDFCLNFCRSPVF